MPVATKPGMMVTYLKWVLPRKSHDPWPRGLARSLDKLKPLYLHYHSVYGHQTWQDGDPGEAAAHKVVWPFDHVVLQNHVTN